MFYRYFTTIRICLILPSSILPALWWVIITLIHSHIWMPWWAILTINIVYSPPLSTLWWAVITSIRSSLLPTSRWVFISATKWSFLAIEWPVVIISVFNTFRRSILAFLNIWWRSFATIKGSDFVLGSFRVETNANGFSLNVNVRAIISSSNGRILFLNMHKLLHWVLSYSIWTQTCIITVKSCFIDSIWWSILSFVD